MHQKIDSKYRLSKEFQFIPRLSIAACAKWPWLFLREEREHCSKLHLVALLLENNSVFILRCTDFNVQSTACFNYIKNKVGLTLIW